MINIIMNENSDENVTNDNAMSSSSGNSTEKPKTYRESSLVLVDLAGSERASASDGRNFMRLEEAKAINLSLSALGNCMRSCDSRVGNDWCSSRSCVSRVGNDWCIMLS